MIIFRIALILLLLPLAGCGYNSLQETDESVEAAWSEVVNQYQRRADLVPNLVQTVKGYATQEQETFTRVTEARARVNQINITSDALENPELLQQFAGAQGELSSALSRLLAVAEAYPELKSDALFRDLQAQLEGTENRIAVARNRYIDAVREFNLVVRRFPTNLTAMIFGYDKKANFNVVNEEEIAQPPAVDFG